MKPELILVGGGGHCKACIDVIEQANTYHIAGIVDLPEKINQKVMGYEIIASDDDLPVLAKQDYYFLITVGQIATPKKRIEIFEKLKTNSAKLTSIISSTAYVSRHAQIGEGTIVMHHAMVNAEAKVGRNCIINSKALIEHDAKIEDHCHLSTGSIVNGGVVIKSGSFVGSNSVIREYTIIGANSVVGLNSKITRDLVSESIVKS